MYLSPYDAPEEILNLAGPCGPLSVWLVLKRYGIEVDPIEIIGKCRYTDEYGCFLVCMTEALVHFGLKAKFHTDVDPSPKDIEKYSYSKIKPYPAAPLTKLLKAIEHGSSVVVSYLAHGGEGHFSPLIGEKANKLELAYSSRPYILKSEFRARWRANEILRQSIIVT